MPSPTFTIVLNNASAETYARRIEERFPQIRAIAATDAETLSRHIADADALLAFHFPVEVLDKAKKLRWFQCTGAGVDSLLSVRDRADHITVTNARGLHADIIADFVMGGIAALQWDFRRLLSNQTIKKWDPREVAPLSGRTLGVVGLGSIGATIARRAKSAGMTVVGSKRDLSRPVEAVDTLFSPDSLHELLPLCDFVVLAMPATADTVGVIDAAQIARMRRNAFLINIARGSVVVEAELIQALQTGAIAGAILDVFEREPLPEDSPLWNMPNVIVTPHMAGNATEYTDWVFSLLAENIERFLAGRPLKNVVDLQLGY